MLTTLLAWIYITFLSWMWGILFFDLVKRISKTGEQLPHFTIICITGLSSITVFAGILSLFIPLGNWWVQLLFFAPCFILFFKKSTPHFFSKLKSEFLSLHIFSLTLLAAMIILMLVMSSWTIVHPDTLGYHAQTIQWIEKYKAVPGLVHLHPRFGYQGLWFVDVALFRFSFTGTAGITFLNTTVLLWFFIFIVNRINFNFFKEGKKTYGLLWFILLASTMWSYTQVRLTATSASPDFIAAIFVLAVIYLMLEKSTKHLSASEWMLAAFLSVVAVTAKLSVAPLLLIAAAAAMLFLIKREIKFFFFMLLISALTLIPFIARNIITSGFIVFPSASIDIANVDWKYGRELTENEKKYITAYARKPGVVSKQDIDTVLNMKPAEWIPVWWQQRSTADKVIIAFLVFAFFAALLSIKKIIRSGFVTIFVLLILLGGIIFWFINAPDPRFGYGQILGFISAIAYLLLREKEISFAKPIPVLLLVISAAAALAYTGYRFKNFYKEDQWFKPLGIEKTEYATNDCSGLRINSPSGNKEFGITPVPCTDLGCDKFSPRGLRITDGFRAK